MNYKIEYLKSSDTIFMRNVGPYGDNSNFEMMKEFKKFIVKNCLKEELNNHGILGIALDNPEQTLPEKCRYDLILFVKDNGVFNSEVEKGYLEGDRYAVFTIPHTSEDVQCFWMNFETIISKNDIELSEKSIIERYKEEGGICEFLIPIK